ncbi:MAG TPA: hypothetical protein VMY80_10900 [Anaerolineae bacterium]|nr:hypothetical protein [Anaerolineae bacterium]
MTPLTLGLIRWVAYALLIVAAVLVGLAITRLITARRAPFYVMRRNALTRATRWALAALASLVVAVLLLLVVPSLLAVVPASVLPTVTLTSMPTATSRPTPIPTITPTRRPTATPPFIPTNTPAILPPESALSPLPSAVPAGEDAHIAIITLATEQDASDQPVDPGVEFPSGDHRMYLFFTYEGMRNGTMTTFAWYKDGQLIDYCSDTWLWGLAEGREWGERGRTSYFCKPPGGWVPGTYEIRVFIETRLQGIAQFVIEE